MLEKNNNYNILVVDDSDSTRLLITVTLRPLGFSPSIAETAEEALEKIKEKTPDILILDNMLPGMSGIELLQLLKSKDEYKGLFILMLSGLSNTQNKIEGLEVGADDYMSKPFNPKELMVKIKAICRILEMRREIEEKSKTLKTLLKNINNDMAMAKKIYLSQFLTEINSVPGTKMHASYLPCEHFGADYYEVIPINNNHWGIITADTSGHGLSGTFITIMFRHILQKNILLGTTDPANVINNVDKELKLNLITDDFVAALYGVYNSETLQFTYCSAGFPIPLIIRNKKSVIHNVDFFPPLGIEQYKGKFFNNYLQLQKNDFVLFYSDGAIESMNPKGEMYGLDRLINVIINCKTNDTNVIIDAITNKIAEFSEKSSFIDDITLLGMSIT